MAKEDILREDFKKAFQRINEYTVNTGLNIDEADEPNDKQDAAPEEEIPIDPQNSDDLSQEPVNNSVPPQGLAPQEPTPNVDLDDSLSAPESQEQPDDTVIDVSDITDSQEDIKQEVAQINDKYDRVVKALDAFEKLIKASNEKIDSLKGEYEKRNPTQLEKLNMQTAHSYPFNVTPEEYWKEKEKTSNYRTGQDNKKEEQEFVITKKDVEGDNNWKGIADTLDDNLYDQSLDNLFKI